MGIIDDDVKFSVQIQTLHPALYAAHGSQGFLDNFDGNPLQQCVDNGGHTVVDHDLAGDGKENFFLAVLGHQRVAGALDAVFHISGIKITFRIQPVGVYGNAFLFCKTVVQLLTPRIVAIDDVGFGGIGKQLGLGFKIIFKGFVIIQMVLGQVGENAVVKGHAVHAVKIQRVRGNLHHQVLTASFHHFRNDLLYLQRIWGGTSGVVDDFISNLVVDGADQAAFASILLKNALEHMGDRRLSIGAGHAGNGELSRRMAVKTAGHGAQHVAGVFYLDIHDAILVFVQIVFIDYQNCAPADGVANIFVSVCFQSLDGHKQAVRDHLLGVIGNMFNIDLGIVVPYFYNLRIFQNTI